MLPSFIGNVNLLSGLAEKGLARLGTMGTGEVLKDGESELLASASPIATVLERGRAPLQPSVPSGPFAVSPLGNVSGEITMQELLANDQLIPGMRGAYLKVKPGEAIRFGDLSQLTINHNGAEFMLSREIVWNGNRVSRRWRIYSGTPDQIPPPRFYDPNAFGGAMHIERIVGHTHPRPVPFDPIFMQPSGDDILNLTRIAREWRQVYGPQSEPFGRIIWGLNPGETTIYGIGSTPGRAVPPRWLRRP